LIGLILRFESVPQDVRPQDEDTVLQMEGLKRKIFCFGVVCPPVFFERFSFLHKRQATRARGVFKVQEAGFKPS
jgi:hypothetical protein